jgi:hypothetical protein
MDSGGDQLGIHGKCASKALGRGDDLADSSAPTITWEKCFPTDRTKLSKREQATARTIRRYALQSAARDLLPREAVAKCMRRVIPGAERDFVSVLYSPAKEAAHFGGLQICKSVWHCPVCSAKISEKRREDLTTGLRNWSELYTAQNRRVLLVTFTLQHDKSDDLSVVYTALKRARRLLVSGRKAKPFNNEYGIVGHVRSLELTHGANGWHPHLHVLMFFDQEVPIVAFEAAIKARWSECVQSAGRYASWEHGCDVRFSDADIADYVAKWGYEPKWTPAHEMAKSGNKIGRRGGNTPMQLLSDYLDGDQRAGRLWMQYAVNFKGERQLHWSKGMRQLLGLAVEKTDEELAVEQDEIAVILASLTVGAWRVVIGNDARGELLEVASSGDVNRVQTFLARLGVGESYHGHS